MGSTSLIAIAQSPVRFPFVFAELNANLVFEQLGKKNRKIPTLRVEARKRLAMSMKPEENTLRDFLNIIFVPRSLPQCVTGQSLEIVYVASVKDLEHFGPTSFAELL